MTIPALKLTHTASQVAPVLSKLSEMKNFEKAKLKVKLERQFQKYSNWLLATSFMLLAFTLLMILAFPQHAKVEWRTPLVIVLLAVHLTVIASFVLMLIGSMVSLYAAWTGYARICMSECIHDFANVHMLRDYSSDVLALACDWLRTKQEREERRLTRFFGGSEKLALFALIGVGWAAMKEIQAFASEPWLQAIVLALACLGGMAIGGMAVKYKLDQIGYQISLLSFALSARNAENQAT